MYLVKTPWWLRGLYPGLEWRAPAHGPGLSRKPLLYLTFDDGPHEWATPFVLDQLAAHQAKASFFCIGKNIDQYPQLFQRILVAGHRVGNHTQNHLNGWKTPVEDYLENITQCQHSMQAAAAQMASLGLLAGGEVPAGWRVQLAAPPELFRPPYGRISRAQVKALRAQPQLPQRIIMWDVLSGDFDPHLSPEKCLDHVLVHAQPGSIVVFHDSTKAWEKLQYVLPRVLDHFSEKGYGFAAL